MDIRDSNHVHIESRDCEVILECEYPSCFIAKVSVGHETENNT